MPVLIALIAAGALCTPQTLNAQVLYGSIVGHVKDSSGGAVPGAEVTATNQQTNIARTAVTDRTGAYSFPTLRPGDFTVRVTLPGFKDFTKTDIPVTLNNITRVNVALEVGQRTDTITVTAKSAAMLQSDRAEVRAEVTEEQLENLPVGLGRNYQELFGTLAGFTPPEEAHSIQTNPSRSLRFNVNGTSDSINNTRIDGASSINPWLPHLTAYVPSLEAIQTVNVVTNSFDAEQGLAGGAAISVQLKSGTNKFHGSVFGNHHDQTLRAKNFFHPEGKRKDKFIINQWGATFGGPILRDKLFFFTSYEGTGDRRNASRIVSVPTEKVRNGDFSDFSTKIYDPMTGSPDGTERAAFAGNIIPDNRKDPIIQKIVGKIPNPNLPRDDGSFSESNNYFASGASIFNRWTIDTKVDWNVNSKLNMFGRYSHLTYDNVQPTVFGKDLVGQALTTHGGGGGNPGTGQGSSDNFSYGLNYIFSPRLLMDANFGFARFITDSRNPYYGSNIGLDQLGIPGTNGSEVWQSGFPRFDVSSYADFGNQESYMPYYRSDDQIQFVGNFSWTRSTHELRWGADINLQHMNHAQPEGGVGMGSRGRFDFSANVTRLCTKPDGKGGCKSFSSSTSRANSFAAFLLGLPSRVGKNTLTVAPYTTRNRGISFYARDRWQVTPNFTLSYGTRWEYFPIPFRVNRGMERYDPETDKMILGGVGTIPRDMGVKVSKLLFAPRVGIAYRAGRTLVLRAGYGLTNDPYPLARPLRTDYPVFIELIHEGANSWNYATTMAQGIPPIVAPDLGNGVIDIPGDVYAVAVPTDFKRGYIQSWNFTVQKELPWGLSGEIAYVATRQIRQLGFRELNWSGIGEGNAGRQLYKRFGRTASTNIVTPIGGSHYDSMQARLDRRFSNGQSWKVNYTWGKSISNSGESNSDGTIDINIPEYYYLNRRISSFDRTHNFNLTNITELPFGPGKRWLNGGGLLSTVVGGWQLNNILNFRSGRPFTVTSSSVLNAAGGNSQRADQVKPNVEIYGKVGQDQSWFDPFAFAPVDEARFGTASFNSMRGPGYANWNAGLFRHFRVNERVDVQFRAEAFNVTNSPHFGNPGTSRSSLRLNADGSIQDLNGFTEVLSASGERYIRFGLRIGF